MSLVDKARSLRAIIESLSVNLDDDAAIEAVELFPTWHEDIEYVTGDRLKYMGILYKVLHVLWYPIYRNIIICLRYHVQY